MGKEFDILTPKKNVSGTRKYSSVDLKNIKLIYDLVKVKGYTLEGAKNKLKSSKEIFEVVKKLEKIKSKLINIEKELNELVMYEKNRQLNQFSLLLFKKLKQNIQINEY